jgi:flagellar P-ring protein precursor FlgI
LRSHKLVLLAVAVFLASGLYGQTRVKDISEIQGFDTKNLVGLGLVTGVDGQGDSSSNTLLQYVLKDFLTKRNFDPGEEEIDSNNVAVVTVTAELPAYVRPGDRMDISVASMGDAKSLEGGELILTDLKGPDGEVYAQGAGPLLITGGFDGPKTRGRVPNGAMATQARTGAYVVDGKVSILLHNPDFATAGRILEALQTQFNGVEAQVLDPSQIVVTIPTEFASNPASFIAQAEQITVIPDVKGKVIVDPNSGVVVMGQGVRIAPVAVSVRGAKIMIGSEDPFAGDLEREQFAFEETSTVDELVSLLQTLGITTDNIIEILEAIDRAGALYGSLEIL